MRVAVAGAGWFGCHIASELIRSGHEVAVFEASDDVFSGASGINQNRLHLGFHYPRSYETREQSREGFRLFVERYPELSTPVPSNVYAIAAEYSFIDFETYRQVMDATRLEYTVHPPGDFGLVGMAGAIICGERLVATDRARRHFRESLRQVLRLNEPVTSVEKVQRGVLVNGERFDAAVSCTWGRRESHENIDMHYESCLILLYRGSGDPPAITVMDGPFFSIYPVQDGVFTLTSVTHTPLCQHGSFAEAQTFIDRFDSTSVCAIRERFESEAMRYYPHFLDRFEYMDFQMVVKTKLSARSDPRTCHVTEPQERVIEVLAGKIDSIFFASDRVQNLLFQYS